MTLMELIWQLSWQADLLKGVIGCKVTKKREKSKIISRNSKPIGFLFPYHSLYVAVELPFFVIL